MANERICPHHGALPVTSKRCPTCNSVADLGPGTELNTPIHTYTIVQMIGRGGMGVIYQATDETGRQIAIKEFRLEPNPNDPGNVTRGRKKFHDEFQTLRSINTINNPFYTTAHEEFDCFSDLINGTATQFMAIEFVPGQTLENIAKGKALSNEDILRYAITICEALEIIHAIPLIHRDIKPENVMEEPSGRIRILDMGAAKQFDPAAGTGTGIGTRGYFPFEQEAGYAEPRSDMYAVGMTIMRFKFGLGVLQLNYNERIAKVDDLPDEWQFTMRKVLAEMPDDRQADVTEFKDELQGLLPQVPALAPPITANFNPIQQARGGQAPAPAPIPRPVRAQRPAPITGNVTINLNPAVASFFGKYEYRQPTSGTVLVDGRPLANAPVIPYITDVGPQAFLNGSKRNTVVTDFTGGFRLPSNDVNVPNNIDERQIKLVVKDPAHNVILIQQTVTIKRPQHTPGVATKIRNAMVVNPAKGLAHQVARPFRWFRNKIRTVSAADRAGFSVFLFALLTIVGLWGHWSALWVICPLLAVWGLRARTLLQRKQPIRDNLWRLLMPLTSTIWLVLGFIFASAG